MVSNAAMSSACVLVCLGMSISHAVAQDPLCELDREISEDMGIEFIGEVELTAADTEEFSGENKEVIASSSKAGACFTLSETASVKGLVEWAVEDSAGSTSDALVVGELVMDFRPPLEWPLRMVLGYATIPFGVYESEALTSPLTADAFEMKGKFVSFIYERASFPAAEAYVFRAERDWELHRYSGGRDSKQNQGIRLGINIKSDYEWENYNLSAQAGISNNAFGAGDVISSVSGHPNNFAGQFALTVERDDWFIWAEAISALSAANSRQPSALSMTAGYTHEGGILDVTPTLSYSQTGDLSGILPKRRVVSSVLAKLNDHVEFKAEYARDWNYGNQNSLKSSVPYMGARTILKW